MLKEAQLGMYIALIKGKKAVIRRLNMKKLLVLMIAASFSLQAAPFYKVKCYDSNNKIVSCDEAARAQAKKKIASKKKAKKKETLAQKKARERAIALRDIARQNEELKNEIQSLRKAALLAAAKNEEKPAETAVLAPQTQTAVPAPTAQTVVAKDTVSDNPNKWSFEIANEAGKSFKTGTPLTNMLDLDVYFQATDHMSLGVEQEFTWNWTTTTSSPSTDFRFENLLLMFNYAKIFQSDDKLNTLDGDINTYIATTKRTRDAGQLANARLRLKFKRSFNDNKGALKFEPAFTWYINKAATQNPASVTNDYIAIGDDQFEKLNPNNNYRFGLKSIFNHQLMENVTFEAYVDIKSTKTHADNALSSGGTLVTVTPAGWVNTMEIGFPKIIVNVSERFAVQALFKTSTSFDEFKLFNTDPAIANSDTAIAFRISYAI